jgi:hypothetical protein
MNRKRNESFVFQVMLLQFSQYLGDEHTSNQSNRMNDSDVVNWLHSSDVTIDFIGSNVLKMSKDEMTSSDK